TDRPDGRELGEARCDDAVRPVALAQELIQALERPDLERPIAGPLDRSPGVAHQLLRLVVAALRRADRSERDARRRLRRHVMRAERLHGLERDPRGFVEPPLRSQEVRERRLALAQRAAGLDRLQAPDRLPEPLPGLLRLA